MTMVVVTHEMMFARKIADQVVLMDEGRIVESGRPEDIFDNPQSPRLRRFLSEVLQARPRPRQRPATPAKGLAR